jgi:hypothetical protein
MGKASCLRVEHISCYGLAPGSIRIKDNENPRHVVGGVKLCEANPDKCKVFENAIGDDAE